MSVILDVLCAFNAPGAFAGGCEACFRQFCSRLEFWRYRLAYAIGVAEPVSVHVNSEGTGKLPDDKLAQLVREHFPLTPCGIIDHLELKRPIYRATAALGHFGRQPQGGLFTWEKMHHGRQAPVFANDNIFGSRRARGGRSIVEPDPERLIGRGWRLCWGSQVRARGMN